jgi:hypothetical protein
MDYFVSIEKGVAMKVSKKVLLLTAIMGMTWLGSFAMDGVATKGASSISTEETEYYGTASSEESDYSGTSSTEKVHQYGMEVIDNAVERVYPSESIHTNYVPMIRWDLGGPDPLDRVTIYDGGDYYKYVTYGLTELYDKKSKDLKKNGFGMEFTFKLKKDAYKDEERELKNVVGILQTLARSTKEDGEIFKPYEYIYTGQTVGMDIERKSNIVGFITIPDRELKPAYSAYGRADFIAFIGVTEQELQAVMKKELTVKELYEKLGTDVTSYTRKSVI